MAAVMSFHAEKCCYLVSEHDASAAYNSSWSIVHLYLFITNITLVSELTCHV